MNEIVFRGKTKHGEWVFGFYWRVENFHYIRRLTNKDIGRQIHDSEVLPETVGQYWKTVNGQRLFDDDIFEINNPKFSSIYRKVIQYIKVKSCFCITDISILNSEIYSDRDKWSNPETDWWIRLDSHITVIGNIHDNPEMIK